MYKTKTLLKYLKKYHIDIYAMLLEDSLKSSDYAFYYDIKSKKLFKYSITDIENYYKRSYKDFSWNPFLIEIYLHDTKKFIIEYQNYNNFLSVKKLKKVINNDLYYRREIKKYLRDEAKKEQNKDKKENLCNLLFNL